MNTLAVLRVWVARAVLGVTLVLGGLVVVVFVLEIFE